MQITNEGHSVIIQPQAIAKVVLQLDDLNLMMIDYYLSNEKEDTSSLNDKARQVYATRADSSRCICNVTVYSP